jgi:hypothetical protein
MTEEPRFLPTALQNAILQLALARLCTPIDQEALSQLRTNGLIDVTEDNRVALTLRGKLAFWRITNGR